MIPRLGPVMRQTKQRLFGGDTHAPEKLVSLFEPSTEIIPKGKAAKPTECGKRVKIQEAENQIIIDYPVYDQRPHDADCCCRRSRFSSNDWGGCRVWWPPTPDLTPPPMKRKRSNGA